MTDAKILRIVQGFRRGILGCDSSDSMCFAICAPLASFLESAGIRVRLIEGILKYEVGTGNHFWLELPDGRVIDPTADQFNRRMRKRMPKVYLGPRLPWLHEYA